MPELPEVETTRSSLAPVIEGRRIERVDVRRERMVRHQAQPGDFALRLTGRRVLDVDRIGKFIITSLAGDGGERDMVWVTHLGMSGHIELAAPGTEEAPHTNVVVVVGGAGGPVEVRLVDPRTFGFVWALTPDEMAESSLAALGPDAHAALPRSSSLAAALAGRTAPIKALLLDQRIISGLGNIYADEALFRARIHPTRQGGSLTGDEVARLRRAVKVTLDAGLRWGGTTLDDLAYLLPDGRAGEFARRLMVYGRTGLPCRRCGTPIERIELRARGTHFCPVCQV
jgi:formamidopyrimidine-DNA glycosylase